TFRSSTPAALTKDLVARFICWHIQEQALGGLDRDTAKLLDGLARGDKSEVDGRRLKPGTVLVREYQGERHTVTVVRGGCVAGQGTHPSPSPLPRATTRPARRGPPLLVVRACGPRP